MHNVLHPIDAIDRLYMSRKEEEKRLASIENCVNESMQGIENYMKKSEEKLITAISNSVGNIRTNIKTAKIRKKKKEK